MIISFPRVLALAGLLLLAVGAFLPTNDLNGVTVPACTLGVPQEQFVALDCFSDDVEAGFSASLSGLVLVLMSVLGGLAALSPTPTRLWTLALTCVAVVGVLFLYQDAAASSDIAGDYAWGWGVIGGAVVVLVLAAVVGTVRRTPRVVV
jgi:hypothetical protein